MTFLFVVEVDDLRKILVTRVSLTGSIRHIDTGDEGKALSTLLSISIMLFPLLLLPSLFIGSLVILGL